MDPSKHRDLEFAYGSGQINPLAAVEPGLVFDASWWDYIDLMSLKGYNASSLRMIGGLSSNNSIPNGYAQWDFNYPSFTLAIKDGKSIRGFFIRIVTNVGSPRSTYTASINMPSSVDVVVDPPILSFSATGQRKVITVYVAGPKISQQPIMSGSIVWEGGDHVVRTPLVIYTVT